MINGPSLEGAYQINIAIGGEPGGKERWYRAPVRKAAVGLGATTIALVAACSSGGDGVEGSMQRATLPAKSSTSTEAATGMSSFGAATPSPEGAGGMAEGGPSAGESALPGGSGLPGGEGENPDLQPVGPACEFDLTSSQFDEVHSQADVAVVKDGAVTAGNAGNNELKLSGDADGTMYDLSDMGFANRITDGAIPVSAELVLVNDDRDINNVSPDVARPAGRWVVLNCTTEGLRFEMGEDYERER